MPKVTFIDFQGLKNTVEAKVGATLMETAINNSVAGIDADCGGACACATCHVYIDADFVDKLEIQEEMEKSMLEFAEDVRPNSRLSCQITITEDLNNLSVTTPESQ